MKIEPLSAVPSLTSPAAGAAPSERDARRIWADQALRILERDARRSADTHLLPFEAHRLGGIDIYLKMNRATPPAA